MTLLPSHGMAFGSLLLVRTAALAPRADVEHWVRAARAQGSYLAHALDLRATARSLIAAGLVDARGGIRLGRRLSRLAALGDGGGLRDAARVLLSAAPPQWIPLAAGSGRVVRDYIPDADLKALRWLEPDLDAILLSTGTHLMQARQEMVRQRLGEAAEAVVLSALRREDRHAVQVSRISDAYGYDVEVRGPHIDRIEVKGAGPATRGSFHLTRNEFETGLRHPRSWRLVQVVFEGSAFVADVLDRTHVAEVLELAPGAVRDIVPRDTPQFTWEQSALLTAPEQTWLPTGMAPGEDFSAPGFRGPAAESTERAR
ncbi:DUF3883 domain-containing protein [Streptomyces sp. NPDC050617]|uniref:protein NO VEIN domain-containing protein n=1 Tax=Streptomyces sp. NPDC050617 TaxID=3154628 RepID=UPI003415019F